MGIQADTLLLPIVSPAKWPSRDRGASRYPAGRREPERTWRHRLYRVPAGGRTDGIAYGPDAHLARQGTIGQLLDVYV